MIRLARIFQDGVTLQRRMPIRIWGTSDMHQTVSVALNGETLLENAEIGQTFSLVLPVQEAAENARLSITGTYDTVELERVNIGEVWIAGGQSNMEFLLRYDKDGKTEIASADDDDLRFYDVGEYSFPEEESRSHKDSTGWDKWMTFRPEQAEYFSAVAVYFAKELRRCLGVPVGVVGCNWAGTTASSWTDESWLAADPDLRSYLDDYADAVKDLDMEEYCRRYDETLAFMESPAMAGAVDALLRGKFTLRDLLRLLPSLKHLRSFSIPMGPRNPNAPGVLYRAMVKQIAGYTCRGVIWYQGESDDVKAGIYDKLFTAMIRCWRDAWQDELPFLFVQLAPFGKWLNSTGEQYPVLREAQETVSRTVPMCYMASIMDCGMEKDIHPKNKRPVGERLALLARGKVYGEDILCESPAFLSAEILDGEILLRFANAGNGLEIRGSELNALEVTADGRRIDTSASAEGDVLSIRSGKIRKDSLIGIRFAWTAYCEVNLYNSAGLPARPFRVSL